MKRGAVFLTAGLLLAVITAVYLWYIRFSPAARRNADAAASYAAYQKAVAEHDEAMRADTVGGRTPAETIALLADALTRDDIVRAATYFAPEDDPRSPDYLTQNAAERALADLKRQSGLQPLIAVLREMAPAEHKTASKNTVDYISATPPRRSMTLEYNEQTRVWKVQSL